MSLPAGAASSRLSPHFCYRCTQQARAKSSSQESHSVSKTSSKSSNSSCRWTSSRGCTACCCQLDIADVAVPLLELLVCLAAGISLSCTCTHVSLHMHVCISSPAFRRHHPMATATGGVGAFKGSGMSYSLCKVHAASMLCSAASECSMAHMLFCHVSVAWTLTLRTGVCCLRFGLLPQQAFVDFTKVQACGTCVLADYHIGYRLRRLRL